MVLLIFIYIAFKHQFFILDSDQISFISANLLCALISPSMFVYSLFQLLPERIIEQLPEIIIKFIHNSNHFFFFFLAENILWRSRLLLDFDVDLFYVNVVAAESSSSSSSSLLSASQRYRHHHHHCHRHGCCHRSFNLSASERVEKRKWSKRSMQMCLYVGVCVCVCANVYFAVTELEKKQQQTSAVSVVSFELDSVRIELCVG